MLNRTHGLTALAMAMVLTGCSPSPSNPGADAAGSGGSESGARRAADKAPAPPPPQTTEAKPVTSVLTGPAWEVAQPTYDFGRVWTGRTILHPFVVKNVGTATLHLTKPKAHCSCSSPDTYPPAIEPGQTGQIMYRLNLTNKAGDVHETLEAQTDDPRQPILTVSMTGFARTVCQQVVTFDQAANEGRMPPDRVQRFTELRGDFGRVTKDEPLKRVIELRNTSGEPLKLALPPTIRASVSDNFGKTVPTTPMFDVNVVEKEPGELWEMTITGKPPYNTYYNNQSIEFRTGIADYPVYQAFAYAYCPPRVEIVPSKIVFSEIATSRNRRITITNNGTTPFEIKSIACTDPGVSLTLQAPDPTKPGVSMIDVILPQDPNWKPPTYGEIVRILTTDAEVPQIDIYILPHLSNPPTGRPADKPLVFHAGAMLGRS